MEYRIYYGEITAKGEGAWNKKETSPFAILEKDLTFSFPDSWVGFLAWARSELRDEVQVDWASFAWKCYGKDLQELKKNRPNCEIESYDEIEPEKEYGVVFIEMD